MTKKRPHNYRYYSFLLGLIFLAIFLFNNNTVQSEEKKIKPTNAQKINLSGIDSIYSARLKNLFMKEVSVPPKGSPGVLKIYRINTPSNELYIGMKQEMVVKASVSDVAGVLDDFAKYPEMFEDLAKVEIVSRNNGGFSLLQEQKVPIPFISNVVFTLNYFVDDSQPGRKGYLYKLKESNNMKFNDGMIKLVRISENECFFIEYDFVSADWSLLGSIASSKIWESSIEGAVFSNMIIKLKAEHPDWHYSRIKKEAKKITSSYNLTEIVKEGIPADSFL
jgi:hypothetical protein